MIPPYGTGDSVRIRPGDFVVTPDGTPSQKQFSIQNPDFNLKSIRGNAVLRWEYLPGSTMYLVWTRSSTNNDRPGIFSMGRDLGDLLAATDHSDVFLIKIAYWLSP